VLKANKKIIIKKVKLCKTPWQRTKGLMFEDKKRFDYALVFDFPRESKLGSSLHMIFVFFPIDVLFLNSKKEIVDKVTLQPFTPNYTPKKPAKYVIELPEGRTKGLKTGTKISW
jgi:uncharacterized protein